MAEQTTNYWTYSLLIVLQWHFSPLKPPNLISRSGCHIYLVFPLCLWISQVRTISDFLIYVGFHAQEIEFDSLISLSHVDVIIQPAKRTRGKGELFPFSTLWKLQAYIQRISSQDTANYEEKNSSYTVENQADRS